MPRGGLRVGAGRKPKKASVVGMDGQRFVPAPALPVSVAGHPLLEPPADLREPQATVWRTLAPHAIAQQTLVQATVRGFRELVEQAVLKQQIADLILAPKPGTDVDALLRHYTKLAQRLDSTLARFRLTAMGKPEPSAQVKPKAASPWAAAAGGAKS